jgi:hypothetical protein
VTEYVVEDMQTNGDSTPFLGALALSVSQPKFIQLYVAAQSDGTLIVRVINQAKAVIAETILGKPSVPFKVRWETQSSGASTLSWRATISDRNTTIDKSGSAPLLASTISTSVGLNRESPGTSTFTISGLQLP